MRKNTGLGKLLLSSSPEYICRFSSSIIVDYNQSSLSCAALAPATTATSRDTKSRRLRAHEVQRQLVSKSPSPSHVSLWLVDCPFFPEYSVLLPFPYSLILPTTLSILSPVSLPYSFVGLRFRLFRSLVLSARAKRRLVIPLPSSLHISTVKLVPT